MLILVEIWEVLVELTCAAELASLMGCQIEASIISYGVFRQASSFTRVLR